MFAEPQHWQPLLRIVVAMALAAVVGMEREMAARPAGLRTHMLVGGAAALFVSVGDLLVGSLKAELAPGVLRTDPLRMIEAVITGVSFLGAGTIVRHGPRDVEGLTTAASLLLVTAAAVTVAVGQVLLALGTIALALLTLRGMQWLERRVAARTRDGD